MKCRCGDDRTDPGPTYAPRPQPAQSAASTSDSDTAAAATASAYSTSLNLEQLQGRLSASRAARESLGKELSEALDHSRGLGHLGPPWGLQRAAEEEDLLSACLLGRLNPRVFPGTPQVVWIIAIDAHVYRPSHLGDDPAGSASQYGPGLRSDPAPHPHTYPWATSPPPPAV